MFLALLVNLAAVNKVTSIAVVTCYIASSVIEFSSCYDEIDYIAVVICYVVEFSSCNRLCHWLYPGLLKAAAARMVSVCNNWK